MSIRQRPCPDCGAAVVKASALNGGWLPLDPYPDPDGRIRVDVLAGALMVLAPGDPSSGRTKLYQRHACVPAGKAAPRSGRAEQLTLGGGT